MKRPYDNVKKGERRRKNSQKKRIKISTLPRGGTVLVEAIEITISQKFTAVNTGLNGPKTPENSHLFHITYNRGDFQPFKLGINCMQTPYQMLQKKFKCLWQT